MTAFRLAQLLGLPTAPIAPPAGATVHKHYLRDDDPGARVAEAAPRAPCRAPESSPGPVERPDSPNGIGPLEAATPDETPPTSQPSAAATPPRKRSHKASGLPRPPSISQRILACLAGDAQLTARDLCHILQQQINNVSVALTHLHRRGRVARSRTSHPYTYSLPKVPAWRASPREIQHDQP